MNQIYFFRIKRKPSFSTASSSIRTSNEIAPHWHDNEARLCRCFRGQRGLARPECAVCSRPLRIWPLSSGLIIPETQSSSSHPSLSRPLWRACLQGARLHWPRRGLNAFPVTGRRQCQFSCYMHSGAWPGLHKDTSQGLSVSPPKSCTSYDLVMTVYYVITLKYQV